jgi:hypothetical protein
LGGGNPKISKDGQIKLKKEKRKRSGIPKEKGQQKRNKERGKKKKK